MQNKCKFCIHAPVCRYQDKLEDIEKLYIPIKNKAVEYDAFVCEIRCKYYCKDPIARNLKEDSDEST